MASIPNIEKMRSVLFYAFVTLFIIITLLTIFSLFFGLTNLKEKYESLLINSFIIEIGAAIIGLFYSLFGIKKRGPKSFDENNKIRVNVSAIDNGFKKGLNYNVYYEILDEETGEKSKINNINTQWDPDGSLGFTIKEISDNMYIMFGVTDINGNEWISDHFKPGHIRIQKLNKLND